MFNASVYYLMRDNARDFNKVPGPKPSPTRKVHPGFDFSYVAPVNKRFGFTLSGGMSTNYTAAGSTPRRTWRGASAATNGNAFPNTTPDNPYLTSIPRAGRAKVTTRRSFGASIDYKLTRARSRDVRVSILVVRRPLHRLERHLCDHPRGAGRFQPDVHARRRGQGTLTSNHQERNRFNRTYMPTFVWRHDGPVWKADTGIGLSQQSDYNRDVDQGFFRIVNMQRTNVTIAFDDIFYLRPRTITVRDGATGAPVDPFALSHLFARFRATRRQTRTYDQQRTAYGSLRRDFFTRIPFTLKTGLDFREAVRELRGGNTLWNYLGRDGRANTADDSAASVLRSDLLAARAALWFPEDSRLRATERCGSTTSPTPAIFRRTTTPRIATRSPIRSMSKEMVSSALSAWRCAAFSSGG